MRPRLLWSARRLAASVATLSIASTGGLALTSAPAYADTVTASDGASATVVDSVPQGNAIRLQGTGWKHPTNGTGSTIGIKLQGALTTEPVSGPVTNPSTGQPTTGLGLWATVDATADGTFSADITFPTPTNTKPALAEAWAAGTTHQLRLLTGSLESGDRGRSILLTFTVGDAPIPAATPTPTPTPTATPEPTPTPSPTAAPTPAPTLIAADPVKQAALAKATAQVRTDEAALAAIQKKVKSVGSKRTKATAQLAKAKKAAKSATATQRAAAKKKVTSATKTVASLSKQLKSLQAKENKAKKQLASSQATLAGLT